MPVLSPVLVNVLFAVASVAAIALNHFGIIPSAIMDAVLAVTGWKYAGSAMLHDLKSSGSAPVQQFEQPQTLRKGYQDRP